MAINRRLVEERISELEEFIKAADEFCEDDEAEEFIWKEEDVSEMFGTEDTFDYFWRHCGQEERYGGKLEALKELLGEDEIEEPMPQEEEEYVPTPSRSYDDDEDEPSSGFGGSFNFGGGSFGGGGSKF